MSDARVSYMCERLAQQSWAEVTARTGRASSQTPLRQRATTLRHRKRES